MCLLSELKLSQMPDVIDYRPKYNRNAVDPILGVSKDFNLVNRREQRKKWNFQNLYIIFLVKYVDPFF